MKNFYASLALQTYGEATEETIELIKNVETDFTYSVDLPPPASRDVWFYNLASVAGSYAKCHSRKIGAVLVRGKSVVSTGYNGPPIGVPTCDKRWDLDVEFREKYLSQFLKAGHVEGVCPRRVIGFKSGEGLDICPAGHAERNSLINAARLGVATLGTTMYMTCAIPCTPCLVEIINAGVEEIVVSAAKIYDSSAKYLLENSDLKVRLFDFIK